MRRLGCVLAASQSRLGASWGSLDPPLRELGSVRRRLGRVLRCFGEIFRLIKTLISLHTSVTNDDFKQYGAQAPPSNALEASRSSLRRLGGVLAAPQNPLRASWSRLDPPWRGLGSVRRRLRRVFRCFGERFGLIKTLISLHITHKNDDSKPYGAQTPPSNVLEATRSSLRRLGGFLVASQSRLGASSSSLDPPWRELGSVRRRLTRVFRCFGEIFGLIKTLLSLHTSVKVDNSKPYCTQTPPSNVLEASRSSLRPLGSVSEPSQSIFEQS